MQFYCYLIVNEHNHTYIGITNNLEKRIQQHNGILKGGAKATKKSKNWMYKIVVSGLNKQNACSFEWYWKHNKINNVWKKTKSGLDNKIKRLNELLLIWNNLNVQYY